MRFVRLLSLIAVLALTSWMWLVGSAPGAPVVHGVTSGSPIPTTRSPSFAGYLIKASGPSLKVRASIVVPRIKKCGKAGSAIAAGTGAETDGSTSAAALFIGCSGGRAHYYPVFLEDGVATTYSSDPARPGAKIQLSVSFNANGGTLSVVDTARNGASRTLTMAGTSETSDPFIGDSAWPSPGPVPSFVKLTFSKAMLLGHPLGAYAGELVRYDMATEAGTVQIETGSFAGGRESFPTLFEHS